MTAAVALSLLIGVSLGFFGGGGSILTVPILIYALHLEEKSAIATSLFVVGLTSAVAAIPKARMKHVRWRVALLFSAAGMAGAFVGGRVAHYVPATILLIIFALIMFVASAAMWRGRASDRGEASPASHELAVSREAHEVHESDGSIVVGNSMSVPKTVLVGVVVGFVTGFVGAGGGFLIVPALALLGGLSMHQAVGTSLVVIALNSSAGFMGYLGHVRVDYVLAGVVTGAAVTGSFLGVWLARMVSAERLRRAFAVFVALMAVYLLVRQF